jgi:tape measure domain-containing protein
MSRIALALGQIEAKGKLSGQEILQLVNAGLPVIQILAEAFGKTTAEVTAMVSDGLVPANQAIEAITEYIENNFAGAAERQATTWAGLMGTFEDLKNMGLREFFGGLFDVIQPLAVEFSTWLQGEGMEKLREWGTTLGEFTQTIVDKIPLAIESLENLKNAFDSGGLVGAINEFFDMTNVDVLDTVKMQDLMSQGVPENIARQLSTTQQNIFLEGANKLVEAISNAIKSVDWEKVGSSLDTKIAEIINNTELKESGVAFGDKISDFLVGFFTSGNLFDDTLTTKALSEAFTDFLSGAVDGINWGELFTGFMDGLVDIFVGIVDFVVGTDSWRQIGQAFRDGFKGAFESDWSLNFEEWCQTHIVDPIKKFFGIASPSTVFAQIGRDLIYGLIAGIGSVATFAMNAIKGIVATILEPFKWILDALGIDTSSLFGGSGGIGDHDPGRTTPGTPSTGASGTTVNQYFAGATINVGSWDEIIYDCVYPNPFIGSTSGQLTGGGGGTGAPR